MRKSPHSASESAKRSKWEAFLRSRIEKQQRNSRTVARWNGRMLLYFLTPIMALSPLLSPHGHSWQLAISVPLACANAWLFAWWIRWGKKPSRTVDGIFVGSFRERRRVLGWLGIRPTDDSPTDKSGSDQAATAISSVGRSSHRENAIRFSFSIRRLLLAVAVLAAAFALTMSLGNTGFLVALLAGIPAAGIALVATKRDLVSILFMCICGVAGASVALSMGSPIRRWLGGPLELSFGIVGIAGAIIGWGIAVMLLRAFGKADKNGQH